MSEEPEQTTYHIVITTDYETRIESTTDLRQVEKELAYYGYRYMRVFTNEVDLKKLVRDNPDVFKEFSGKLLGS